MLKYTFRLFVFLLLLLVVLLMAIQVPAVQGWLTQKIETHLRNHISKPIAIGAIRLNLPNTISLQDVFIPDEQLDTMIAVGALDAKIKLMPLFRKTVQIDELHLQRGDVRLYMAEDSANWDFVLNGLSGKAVPEKPVATTPFPTAAPWVVTFDDADLRLRQVHLRYDGAAQGVLLEGNFGHAHADVTQINYIDQIYHIPKLAVNQSDLHIRLTTTAQTDTVTTAAALFDIQSQAVDFNQVHLRVSREDMVLDGDFGTLDMDDLSFEMLGDSIAFLADHFKADHSIFQYHIPNTPVLEKGFDPNHIYLDSLLLELDDVDYDNMDVTGNIVQASAKNENFVLKKLTGRVDLSKTGLLVDGLEIASSNTNITSDKLNLRSPFHLFDAKHVENLMANSELRFQADNSNDLIYFYPPADTMQLFRRLKNQPIALTVNLDGSLKDLTIEQIDFRGFESALTVDGTIQNLMEFQQGTTRFDLDISEMYVTKTLFQTMVPDTLLPTYIQLPDEVDIRGTLTGSVLDFNAAITAITKRENAPKPSKLLLNGRFKNLSKLDSTASVAVTVDTIFMPREDLLSYIPLEALPEYLILPDEVMLRGSVSGPLYNLQSDLHLLVSRDDWTNEINAIGNVSGLFTSPNPSFDIKLDASTIRPEDIQAFFADTLLPSYLQLPFIQKLQGKFNGSTDNFDLTFNLSSNTGDWTVDAQLDRSAYDVDVNIDRLVPEELFRKNYLDSLTGVEVNPLMVDFTIKGNGLDLSKSSFADFQLTVQNAKDTTQAGLVVEGKLDKQVMRAEFVAEEKDIRLNGSLTLDNRGQFTQLNLQSDVERFNLEVLDRSENPFVFNGNILLKAVGTGLDTLIADLMVKDIGIQYDKQLAHLDSIHLTAHLDNGQNQLDILSDLLTLKMDSRLDFGTIGEVIGQHIYGLYRPGYPDHLIGKTADYITARIDLHRPDILSMGWISSLQGLRPFGVDLNFDNRKNTWSIQSELPFLHYDRLRFQDLNISAAAQNRAVDYTLSFEKADVYQTAIFVQNFNNSGTLKNFVLDNELTILDQNNKERFDVQVVMEFLADNIFHFHLNENQLLNYTTWTVNDNNAILFGDQTIEVADWRFSKGEQSISMDSRDGNSLILGFDNFDLESVAKLINPNEKMIDGLVKGNLSINNIFDTLYLNTALTVDSLMVLEAPLGNLSLLATTETGNEVDTDLVLKGNGNDLQLTGKYFLQNKYESLDFELDVPALNLATVEPLLTGLLENMEGELTGKVDIEGTLDVPALIGQMQFRNAAFDIDLVNARLRPGPQPILFDANAIEFKNLEILDANGQKGIVSSYILTDDYRDFHLLADVDVDDFMILNTTKEDGQQYYGQLFVDATARLTGSIYTPEIDVTAKPVKSSKLTYVYSAYSTLVQSHEGIVEFLTPPQDSLTIVHNNATSPATQTLIKYTLNLNAEVDENLEIKVITNSLTGDNFEGKVKGNVVLNYAYDGSMILNGRLAIVKGQYLFTYQDVIRRPFQVKEGGTLSWTGDPFKPMLNLDVQYKLRASTYPLIASQRADVERSAGGREFFIVNLNVGGTLEATKINTSIEYPQSDGNTNNQDVTAALAQINRNPSQQNAQAFSLILFNGFVAQNVGQSDFQLIDVSGNITNIINQQLNGIANRYIKFVELDFNLDSYNSNDGTQTDFSVSIRKRFLNDRLVISLDGKTTTETNTTTSQAQTYLDNVTVEYSLTPKGRFKIKLYNERDYDEFIGGTGVKVGGALVFSKELGKVWFR